MPRSLLLPLIAAFALAACSKQADTGAAPAPETAEATVPAEEPAAESTVPADEPAAEDAVDDTSIPADSTTWPTDSTSAQ